MELLLKGKAEVSFHDGKAKPASLKYIYNKDILGRQQGAFYRVDNKKVFHAIISLGE
ncbi:MAG: hypothetical protein WKF91_15835 [Segetibacter sp.]